MTDISTRSCRNCGAEQSYVPGQAKIRCEYCGSEIEIESPKEDELLPSVDGVQLIVPLAISEEELRRELQRHMSQGKHTPDDILESSTITDLQIKYLPAYLFHGSYTAKWTASFGYDRQEAYTAYETRTTTDRHGHRHHHRVPVTRYKTVTDWRPHSGDHAGNFSACVLASTGLEDRVIKLIEGGPLYASMTDFDPQYTAGVSCGEFQVSESSALKGSGKAKIDDQMLAGVKTHAQGNRQSGWNITSAEVNQETSLLLVPVCRAAFEYQGKQHVFWFDGSKPERFVADDLPIDTQRKAAIQRGFIPFYVALFGAIVLAAANRDGFVPFVLAAAALIFALFRRSAILGYSKARRESLLAQKHAAESTNNDLDEEAQEHLAAKYNEIATPPIARTASDKWLLPLLAGIEVALIVLSAIFIGGPSGASNASSDSNSYGSQGTSSAAAGDVSASVTDVSSPAGGTLKLVFHLVNNSSYAVSGTCNFWLDGGSLTPSQSSAINQNGWNVLTKPSITASYDFEAYGSQDKSFSLDTKSPSASDAAAVSAIIEAGPGAWSSDCGGSSSGSSAQSSSAPVVTTTTLAPVTTTTATPISTPPTSVYTPPTSAYVPPTTTTTVLVQVPDLIGKSTSDASQALQAIGLALGNVVTAAPDPNGFCIGDNTTYNIPSGYIESYSVRGSGNTSAAAAGSFIDVMVCP